MRIDDIKQVTATPLSSPAFPPGPYRAVNREYLHITYRTDPDALRAVVPEPLAVDPANPLVKFEVMRTPDTSGMGDFTECGQVIPVTYEGKPGAYLHALYLDNAPAIALGRETAAYPKKAGSPRLFVDNDTLVGSLDYGTLPVATATMGYKHRPLNLDTVRAGMSGPTYMLKVLPHYDGGQRICELLRIRLTDFTVRGAWTAPARLQLFEHVSAPLADLPVREVVSADHILADVTIPVPEVAHDYLA
ncbi:acetoacetate decarboxylase [Streptomyces sp. NPDC048644]|uniref:acetoacetate decarboxylase n=1 Tax=Streptomyces sp. NPDC048644 TaxID=3365582 RepID=UPI003719E248